MAPHGPETSGIQVTGSSKWRTTSAAKTQFGGKPGRQQRTTRKCGATSRPENERADIGRRPQRAIATH
eukprot:11158324-Lingulodinium_polyedra.AAC.1